MNSALGWLSIGFLGMAAGVADASTYTNWVDRHWSGWDPFGQPVETTDFYGSGDLDLDGQLTAADLALFWSCLTNQSRAPVRADVNGNGVVEGADALLLREAIAGAPLPGNWNILTSQGQRVAWIEQMLRIDPVSKLPYSPLWRQCGHYATETFLHFASAMDELWGSDYGSGQTTFNLPVYKVTVTGEAFGHAVNSILVGDDPLRFDDWYFFEPQADDRIQPGSVSMPYGSTLRIEVPRHVDRGGGNYEARVTFRVPASGPELVWFHPRLLLQRPIPLPGEPDNEPNLWNPMLLPAGEGILLAERARDDLFRVPEIHAYPGLGGESGSGQPLAGTNSFTRLLDACPAGEGRFHLLWRGLAEHVPALFHGELDAGSLRLEGVSLIDRDRACLGGRVVATPSGEVHVVWLENKTNSRYLYESGLYWTSRGESGWSAPVRLVSVPGLAGVYHWGAGGVHDLRDYCFDLCGFGHSGLMLAWVDREDSQSNPALMAVRFQGRWEVPETIEVFSQHTLGLDLVGDRQGLIHLVYWSGRKQENYDWMIEHAGAPDWLKSRNEEGRGLLQHRTWADGLWSPSSFIDSEGQAICPRLIPAGTGSPLLVWEKGNNAQGQLWWSGFDGSSWLSPQEVPLATAVAARYPAGAVLPGNRLGLVWTEYHPRGVRVGSRVVSLEGVTRIGVRASCSVPGEVTLSWGCRQGCVYAVEWRESLNAGSWSVLADDLIGGASGLLSHQDVPDPQCRTRFYRVRLVP